MGRVVIATSLPENVIGIGQVPRYLKVITEISNSGIVLIVAFGLCKCNVVYNLRQYEPIIIYLTTKL